ncbi:MAG: GNAT family N-acetyltransferase [Mycobacterium sp.]|nr:GNAT family N-acetyltransferase [Mycobacterium sp.]
MEQDGVIAVPDRPAAGWRVRPALAYEVWPVRHRVLRPERPWESSRYAGDDRPGTRHFAVLDRGRPVGVVSVYHEDPPAEFTVPGLEPGRGWHLRGMATLEEIRGTGAGSALLRAALADAVLAGAGAVWCKAGGAAAGFYSKHGFKTMGHEFEIAGIGPHLFMYWMDSGPAPTTSPLR